MSAPESLTYQSLVSDILKYAERSDQAFVDQVPRFIMLAEQRLALEAKGLGFVRVVNGNFSPNSPLVDKPARWRQSKSWSYTDSSGLVNYLHPRKYEYCKLYASGEGSGAPEYYSDADYDHLYVAMTPSLGFAFEFSYYERPDPLSEINPTNWTTRNAPQLLLYACLLEAQPWLKNLNMLSMWQSQYAETIAALQREELNFNHDSTEAGK